MDKSYAASASDRPPSEGVPNPNLHVPENATIDGNGNAGGEVADGEVAVEEGVGVPGGIEEGVAEGEVSEVKSRKSGSERFLLVTFILGLVSFSEPTCGITTELEGRLDGLWLQSLKPLWLRPVRI